MAKASQSELRRTLVLLVATAAIGAVVVFVVVANRAANSILKEQVDQRLRELATHSGALISTFMDERYREIERLANLPVIVTAARQATQRSDRTGLARLSLEQRETRFAETHAIGGLPDLTVYLQDYVLQSDFAEIFFTDRYGHTVTGSGLTSDFVQSDEEWWQGAFQDGEYEGDAEFDASAGVISVEIDIMIPDPEGDLPWGVIKGVFELGRLTSPALPRIAAAPTWRWRGRNSRAWRSPSCTANGARTSSA